MTPTGTPTVPSHSFPAAQHPGNPQDLKDFIDQQVKCLHEAFTKNITEFKGNFDSAFRIVESQRESNEIEKLKSEKVNISGSIIRRNPISTSVFMNCLVAG